jgi:RNA polymerase sigma-70 factor, ECF subfamily
MIIPPTREQAFEALVLEHARDIYRIANRLCGDSEQAQDLTQECFLEAWKGLDQLREASRSRSWLLQILRNRWHRQLSRTVVKRTHEQEVSHLQAAAVECSHETLTVGIDWVSHLLERLEPRYREVFVLVVMEGYLCREVATLLEIPIGTVLSRLHRARLALRADVELQRACDESDAKRERPLCTTR